MKLIQAKLRGTGPLLESNWFELSAGLNQFHFIDKQRGTVFLRALQTLHPLVSCKKTDPFRQLPHYEKRGAHTRHIQPAKRTIALGVFGATAELAKELGLLHQSLYETDRIELGRRLDYSRWLNFVELSSSTRWKEVEAGLKELLIPLQQTYPDRYNKMLTQISDLKGTDRVKDDLAGDLLSLFNFLTEQQKDTPLFEETVALIKRDAYFQTARTVVLKRLPFLIYCNSMGEVAPPISKEQLLPTHNQQELFQLIEQRKLTKPFLSKSANQHNLPLIEKIQGGIRLSLAVSKELQRSDPIFLFDAPERNVAPADHKELRHLIQETSQTHQCLYLSATKNFFQQTDTGKNYNCSQLELIRD